MPELPEVETICRGLALSAAGAEITGVRLSNLRLRRDYPDSFAERIVGKKITSISRRAKYVIVHLNNGSPILIFHLGMSGKLLLRSPEAVSSKHDHVILTLNNGIELALNDPRRFGMVALFNSEQEMLADAAFSNLGLEPFDKKFTAAVLHTELKKRKTAVKVALMDQAMVVGVGNIYASEALYRCRIHPSRPANSIDGSESEKILKAVRDVLREAIESGGSTLRDYANANGETGYFQHNFAVYGRGGKPCRTCGADIMMMRMGGRSTFYCISCQN